MSRKVPRFDKFKPTSPAASRAMQRNRSRDTRAELLLRRELWKRGFRYRLHSKNLPGKPDIVFVRQRVAVFCDGDFWHGRDWERRRKKLKEGSNAAYWIPKIEANMRRDKRHTASLEDAGWVVVRLWEGDVLAGTEDAADRVEVLVRSR